MCISMHRPRTTLVKHPKLRLYVMHAGYPMLDDMLTMLYQHPQLHVEVGVIVWSQPRAAFYRYLQAMVDAGFGNRIMFGSDQMVWPGVIERSINVINAAPFLSAAQKRDILYNNAARFLRLSEEEMARHRRR
jgi:predicted TIM-barrel fold metal-dependent hydrolase